MVTLCGSARAVALEAPRIEGTAVSSLVVLAAPGTTSVFECERSSSSGAVVCGAVVAHSGGGAGGAAQRRTSNMRA